MLRIIGSLLIIIGFLSALFGYCDNIYKLCAENETIGKVAARIVGIFFFPLGCIIGWF